MQSITPCVLFGFCNLSSLKSLVVKCIRSFGDYFPNAELIFTYNFIKNLLRISRMSTFLSHVPAILLAPIHLNSFLMTSPNLMSFIKALL